MGSTAPVLGPNERAMVEVHHAKLWAECLREIGILVAVFFGLFEQIYRPTDLGLPWHGTRVHLTLGLGGLALGLAFMWVGVKIELRSFRKQLEVEARKQVLDQLRKRS
jgi:hypothetical protein